MRRAFVSHEHRLILYWSPKCGCTSLADWMVFGLLQREGVPRSRTRHWLGENGYFAKARDLLGETKGYHSVAFTRDPFDRIVSAFVNKFIAKFRTDGSAKWLVSAELLEPFALRLHRQISQENRWPSAVSNGMTFVQFLTYVNEAIAARGAKEPSLNHHWNTQVSFRWAEAGGQPDEIYDMKQFMLGIDALNARFGVAYRPARANFSRYGNADDGFVGDIGAFELARAGVVPSREQFLSSDTAALVASAYANDYERLGYRHVGRERSVGAAS